MSSKVTKFFPCTVNPYSERKANLDRVASPEGVTIAFYLCKLSIKDT